MHSQLFHDGSHKDIQRKIKAFLNEQDNFLTTSTAQSPRAVGAAIEAILADNLQEVLGPELCNNYSADFTRRAMADMAFEDRNKFHYKVDVKTHRLSAKFSMPNLTSVKRLAKFYEDDNNYFTILMVSYNIDGIRVIVDEVYFVPIEFLGWDCLTIGALGWGQIQIANSKIVTIHEGYSRKSWMVELCDTLMKFYPKEINKINSRIERFQKVKKHWGNHPD